MGRPIEKGGRRHPAVFILPLVFLLTAAGCAPSAEEYYARGRRALATNQLAEASRNFHRCIELDPARGDAYLALGKIYLKEEKWSTAANAFRQATRLNPRLEKKAAPLLTDALYRDAVYELALGNRPAAITSLGALYAREPDYPGLRETYTSVLISYGRDAVINDDYISGVSALKEALRVDPTNVPARKLLDQTRFAAD